MMHGIDGWIPILLVLGWFHHFIMKVVDELMLTYEIVILLLGR